MAQTDAIQVSTRQIQRGVQRVGQDAQAWQEREAQPGRCNALIMYGSADGTGVSVRPKELAARAGKQPDGTAKTRQVYLGCVFTPHRTDEEGHPVRDYESITNMFPASNPLLRFFPDAVSGSTTPGLGPGWQNGGVD